MIKPGNCPKCEGAMVQGFIPDFFHHSASGVGGWNEGPPKKSFWTGTKAALSKGIPVGAFRCSRCGFLELYASKEFAAA
jgi:hypothetical protein